MVLLGWTVGRGTTRLDSWFLNDALDTVGGYSRLLLVFTDPVLLVLVLLTAVAVALHRRQWRLAVVIAVCPMIAVAIAQICKLLFGRTKGGSLAYPSGHTTALVAVAGMILLVAGARLWAVTVAATVILLGMFGLAMTYHYFTDTVGALLLGTAVVCVAARVAGCVPTARASPVVDAQHALSSVRIATGRGARPNQLRP